MVQALLLGFGLFISLPSVHAAPEESVNPEFYPYDPMPYRGSSYAYCQAQTICPNGVPIGCYAYGSAAGYAACTWTVFPGRYVECTGFNDMGFWATSWANCY